MTAAPSIPLGAPGLYKLPDDPIRALTGVRMDVCAFVGVAPRGPVREPVIDEEWPGGRPTLEPGRPRRRSVPVAVESFDEYRRLYGGFEGPGLLPYSVASFFEQGGRRAYIVRIVHDYGNAADNALRAATGMAGGCQTSAGGAVRLAARSEGSWGNTLTAAMTFRYTPLSFESATVAALVLPESVRLPAGARLCCLLPSGARLLRTAATVARTGRTGQPSYTWTVQLDAPLAEAPLQLELVEGTLTIDDGAGRRESFDRVGLSPAHPRWAATVLCLESQLAFPDPAWLALDLEPDTAREASPFAGGIDAYSEITADDFFDPRWLPGDTEPGDGGIQALALNREIAALVAPDLYSPFPLAPPQRILDPPSLAGPEFAPCVRTAVPAPVQANPVADLEGLRLDPRLPADLTRIQQLQLSVEQFAASTRSFIALLDVPPGLNQRQILAWRAPFQSAYAAAYHPWLQVARRDDEREQLIRVPPAGAAAGLIARSEFLFGIPHGPANALVAEAVNVGDLVTPVRHGELHQQAINVLLKERDGVRLSGARTLSRDPAWRQLSVRRLVTMIARTLEEQTQWLMFEPNNRALRATVRAVLTGFLRQLGRAGAFRGATEAESFFVRCDESLNGRRETDGGLLIAEVGIAPAEPLEFIVLRLARDGDGTLTVEE
ncbi:MAG: phage tail sheath family protein [Bryobacterales bacterium]|nr:phage tail sheath family protein [Bryobacterales bacterium]